MLFDKWSIPMTAFAPFPECRGDDKRGGPMTQTDGHFTICCLLAVLLPFKKTWEGTVGLHTLVQTDISQQHVGWIDVMFSPDIHGPQRMKPTVCGDPLTFLIVPQ